jgi:hypothetical protein
VLTRLRRWLRRPAAESRSKIINDPNVSRAGQAVAGMRPGSTAHRPSAAEADIAQKLGVRPYDPTDRQI